MWQSGCSSCIILLIINNIATVLHRPCIFCSNIVVNIAHLGQGRQLLFQALSEHLVIFPCAPLKSLNDIIAHFKPHSASRLREEHFCFSCNCQCFGCFLLLRMDSWKKHFYTNVIQLEIFVSSITHDHCGHWAQ